jgi:hypothetical protein|tara:strand:+ start:991 stop:1218 length:228 start_codon:yes stop_codon:yes gene_type:complete
VYTISDRTNSRKFIVLANIAITRPGDIIDLLVQSALFITPPFDNLNAIQVIKGWRNRKGNLLEKVYDVAWSRQNT